jgi:hypothetical protein
MDANACNGVFNGVGFAEGEGDRGDTFVLSKGGVNGELGGTFDHLAFGVNEGCANGMDNVNVVDGVFEGIGLGGKTGVTEDFHLEDDVLRVFTFVWELADNAMDAEII